jgi:hypothetical protein
MVTAPARRPPSSALSAGMSVSVPRTQVALLTPWSAAARRARRQHVRLGIYSDNRVHLAGDRQGELAGTAAKVDDDVVAGQTEGTDERVDHGRRVAATVLVIEASDLAAETKAFAHSASVDHRQFIAIAVQRAA